MNQLADALRNRQDAERLRARGLQFQGMANNAGPSTVGGNSVQGMRGMAQATPQAINWGSIIQQGVGNYQAAKDTKQANTMDQAADEISQQFMMDTLKDDPEAQRLMQMAQADIPGAEQALSERIAPKKEAMGAFLQHLQSGTADEEMVAELAPRYGVSPELASRAARVARERQDSEAQKLHDQDMELARMRKSAISRAGSSSGKLSFQEFQALSPEERQAYMEFSGNRNATGNSLTPGERNVRAKALQELDEQAQTLGVQQSKYENLRPKLEDPDAFGPTQKVAQILAESDNGIISGIGTTLRSEEAMLLEDYLNDEVLRRMSMLGGNDSNEELNRMRASLPKVLNDQKAALKLMDQLEEWQVDTKEAVRLRREAMQSGDYFDQNLQSRDFYREVREKKGKPPVKAGKIKILSIE